MLRLTGLLVVTIFLVFSQSQPIDWDTLLHGLVSRDPSKRKPAGKMAFDEVIPRICHEDPSLAASDLAGSLKYFEEKDDNLRLQVSGLLAGTAMCRGADSGIVLAPAIPKIIDHIRDPFKRIRENSMRTLALLTPQIPPEVVRVLIDNLKNSELDLAELAAYGVVRAADYNADAMGTILDLLSPASPKEKQILVIGALVTQNKLLIAKLRELVSSQQPDIAKAALRTIGKNGIPAIRATHEQIERVAAETTDPEQKKLAESLLETYRASNAAQ
jgi:hypothetical protein